jgi:hypothetical protein
LVPGPGSRIEFVPWILATRQLIALTIVVDPEDMAPVGDIPNLLDGGPVRLLAATDHCEVPLVVRHQECGDLRGLLQSAGREVLRDCASLRLGQAQNQIAHELERARAGLDITHDSLGNLSIERV